MTETATGAGPPGASLPLAHDAAGTAEASPDESQWRMLSLDAVRQAIQTLWGRHIHNAFPAYLCLKLLSVRDGATHGLKPNWREFFELYFEVLGGSAGHPYLRPFSDRHAVPEAMWLGKNLSGSYSPSSLRGTGPFSQVITVTGSGVSSAYALPDRHWELALTHLAEGAPIPACSLAVFLYRDFGFDTSYTPTAATLIEAFRQEFGYTGEDGEREFTHLYRDDSADYGEGLFD